MSVATDIGGSSRRLDNTPAGPSGEATEETEADGFDRQEFEEDVEEKAVEYSNVIASTIMSVLVGGILLALGVVIIDDFLAIVPDDAFMSVDDIVSPLTTALGLATISSVVLIVSPIANVLIDNFGGMLGRGRRRRGGR
ncbi:MAG: hypothetical protein U5J64_00805 [Halobacteriales archaeon]|nr:hypothetical protein [Halobacteriales archaeon]